MNAKQPIFPEFSKPAHKLNLIAMMTLMQRAVMHAFAERRNGMQHCKYVELHLVDYHGKYDIAQRVATGGASYIWWS